MLPFPDLPPRSPMFVLPLAKSTGGYVTLLLQHQLPFSLITSLDEYRRYVWCDLIALFSPGKVHQCAVPGYSLPSFIADPPLLAGS
jgi:hypothetical protein